MQLREFEGLGVGDDPAITHFTHDARVPDAIVVQHPIGDIAMATINRNIIDIGHIVFDTYNLIKRLLTRKPAPFLDICAQLLLFALQTKANLIRKNLCRSAFDANIDPIAS